MNRLALAILVSLFPMPALAQTAATLICANPASALEKAVCASPSLYTAYRGMEEAFRGAQRRLRGPGSDALARDQAAFLDSIRQGYRAAAQATDPEAGLGPDDELARRLRERSDALATLSPAREGLGGAWMNFKVKLSLRPIRHDLWEANLVMDRYAINATSCTVRLSFRKNADRSAASETDPATPGAAGGFALQLDGETLSLHRPEDVQRSCGQFFDRHATLFRTAQWSARD
ncbi:hypothetical protein [Prosthecomicrobium sp. N25]|uniref:hypothetical protein n=1 Tax=Prosthecomicrobium sp. N25 TaxID=3129254 RepID=UPI003077A68E